MAQTFNNGSQLGDIRAILNGNANEINMFQTSNGSSLVGYTQGGANASSRTVQSRLRDYVSVKDFGAVGDGVTNDTAAFQSAANTGIPIFIPKGTFVLSAAITFTGVATVIGEGIGQSVLLWSNTNGFEITGVSGNNNPVYLSNFSMITSGNGVGTAITINNSAQASSGVIQNRTSVRLIVDNIAVLGTISTTFNGWENGIFCTNVLHATIYGFHFTGSLSTSSQSVIYSLYAIRFGGTGAPVELVISNSWAFHVKEAVHIEECEGVFINQCNFVNVNYGVFWTAVAGPKPQLNLENSHINANIICVNLTNLAQGNISNNLLYARQTALADISGIQLSNCNFTQVCNNIFVNTSSFNFNTIVFISNGIGCIAEGNVFQSATTAIWLKSATTGVRVGNNVYGSVTTKILDESSLSYVSGSYTQASGAAAYSLADGLSFTAIPWTQASSSGASSWVIGNPTRLTARVTGQYRISGTIVFSNNAVGIRMATIQKNGLSVVGYPTASTNPISGANTAISLGEVTVLLNAGDYVEFLAAQTSGSAMSLPNAETAFQIVFVSES